MRMLRLGMFSLFAFSAACSSGGNNKNSGSNGSTGTSGGSGGSATSQGTGGSGGSGTGGGAGATGDAGAGTGALDPADQVSSCSDDLSSATVDANLELVGSLDNSVHELVACGGLTVRVVGVLVQGIIEMILNEDDDITPDGLTFQGEGTYLAGGDDPNQDTDMFIRFYDDSSGTAELIEEDVFLAETYLVGATVETELVMDGLNSNVYWNISFDEVGPRVAMLGFGESPQSPIMVAATDIPNLSPELDDIIIETAVTVVDNRGDSTVNYDVETGPDRVLNIFNGSNLDYRILSVDGENGETGQTLELVDDGWQIEFAGGNKLDGSIEFTVTGGDFDYQGMFSYNAASYADIELSCSE